MAQVIWVTGAAGGIGQHVVRRLLSKGHTVIATDVSAPDPALWPNAAQLHCAAQDVRLRADWERVLRENAVPLGGVDVLIHLAAVQRAELVADITDEQMDWQLDINLKGSIIGGQVVSKAMVAQGRGHLVMVGSLAGLIPIPGMSLYAASKFGLRGFTFSLAHELAHTPVKVSLVAPGTVDSPLTDAQLHLDAAALIYSGPLLSSDEVAEAIVNRALPKKPIQLIVAKGTQGILARIAAMLPGIATKIAPGMIAKGAKAQKAARRG